MNTVNEYRPLLCQVADRCGNMDLDTFPGEVVKKAKYAVMDAVDNFVEGCAVRSVVDPVCAAARSVPGEAKLFGTDIRSAASEAAFFNTVTGSITARNDHHGGGNVHPGSVLVPALLAEGEVSHASGKAFLEALVVGYEVMIRLGSTLKTGNSYPLSKSLRVSMLPTPVGVAFALAKLHRLEGETAVNGAALACNHICGINQWRLEGTAEDVYQNAWDTVNAMHCVRLARAGVRGAPGNLDGSYGFLSLFQAEHQAEQIVRDLGRAFKILEVNSKVTGACARVLAPCQIAQEYLCDPEFQLEKLERLIVHMNKKCTMMSWYTNRQITCQSEAINSVPYGVAATLTAGGVERLSWFPPYDEKIFALMDRIELVYDEYSRERLDPDGFCIQAKMTDGRILSKEMRVYRSMTDEDIERRFLAAMAARYGQPGAEMMRDAICSLERMEDVAALTELF